jgi:hypothetical protein
MLLTLLLGLLFLVGLIFWISVLVDCAMKESDQGNTKIVWVLIILFANLPGALAYLLVRRPQRLAESGSRQLKQTGA